MTMRRGRPVEEEAADERGRRGRVEFRRGADLVHVPGVGLVPVRNRPVRAIRSIHRARVAVGTAPGRVPSNEPYPATVAECLVDGKKYKPAALAALRAFRAAKPFRGSVARRRKLFEQLHAALCAAYDLTTSIRFEVARDGDVEFSGSSSYVWPINRITIRGRLSVLTYLHEFGHALGYGERGACIWSINLFRRMFPRSFAALRPVGHTLRRGV